jgi:hypothetical protein
MFRQNSDPPKCFYASRWLQVLCVFAALAFPTACYAIYRDNGWSLLCIASAIMSLLSLLGLIDALTARVELHPERMVVISNLRRREYPRGMFVRLTHGKGVPIALQQLSGEWIKLPDSVSGGLGMSNTLRAWLRSDEPAA